MNNSDAILMYFQLHMASFRRNPSIQHNCSVCCTSIKWKGFDHWWTFNPCRNSDCISRWSSSFGWEILSKSWQVSSLYIIECKNIDNLFYNVIIFRLIFSKYCYKCKGNKWTYEIISIFAQKSISLRMISNVVW